MSIEDIVLVVTVRGGIRIRTLKLKLPRFRIAWNLMEAAQAWVHAGCEGFAALYLSLKGNTSVPARSPIY